MNENPYQAPESTDRVVPGNTVTVLISEDWVRRVNSPVFIVVAALTGVSVTFAPLALLGLGLYNHWNVLTIIGAVTCFLVIYFVPMFYMRLAGHVIRQVVNRERVS